MEKLYAKREASGSFHPHHTCEGKNKPKLCHPERSRGTCSSLHQQRILMEATLSPCHPDRSEAQWRDLRLSSLPAQTQPVSLIREADSQQQHTQEEKTKHAVPLALVADAVQKNHPDTERE